MSQQSIYGRISQLARADVNAILEQADDPPRLLDQMVRDYTSAISDADGVMAQTLASIRMMEQDAREDQAAARVWNVNAVTASQKADDMRSAGNVGEADKFDNLARLALRRQIQDEADARRLAMAIAEQTEVVDVLMDGLAEMHVRLDTLRSRRSEMAARVEIAQEHAAVVGATVRVDLLDPASEIARFEEKIRREEARILGQDAVTISAIDAQFEGLEFAPADLEIEARLAAMKSDQIS